MARATRASVVKEAAFIESSRLQTAPSQLSSPPQTPSPSRKGRGSTKKVSIAAAKATKPAQRQSNLVVDLPTPLSSRKRKLAAVVKDEGDINELPHNLGKLRTSPGVKDEEMVNHSPTKRSRISRAKTITPEVKDEPRPSPVKVSRAKRTVKLDSKKALEDAGAIAGVTELVESVAAVDGSPSTKGRKPKANPYGLTPGVSPYPDWPHPTAEECQEVNDLLSKVHGDVRAPAMIPAPSITVSGCGEVPSVLDALIRTLLSAATTGTNSSRAFKGLVDTFGLLKEGVGKGSVDWDRVRRADRKEVFEAIKSGGLAVVKSARIQEILDLVYEENIARRDALKKEKDGNRDAGPPGASNESQKEKEAEIARANEHVLSLDHLHALPSDEALSTLLKYPGIGPKTASCVLLFCMQRPSFAVDTHVFRLCKWLNWVPPTKANRNTTYSHCEVRVPDKLKYPLHQLLIRHGKTCPRCRAATGQGSGNWEKGCPIEHLVTRTGARKGGADQSPSGKSGLKKVKGKKGGASDEESEMEMTETEEEEEEEEEESATVGADEGEEDEDDDDDETEDDDDDE